MRRNGANPSPISTPSYPLAGDESTTSGGDKALVGLQGRLKGDCQGHSWPTSGSTRHDERSR